MAKRATNINKVWAIVVLMAVFLAACSPKPVSPGLSSPAAQAPAENAPESTTVPSTPTPALPTQTPTAIPIVHPKEYLISAVKEYILVAINEDVQEMLNYPQFIREYDANGNHSNYIRWWMVTASGAIELNATLTIAQQPWEGIPVEQFPGSEQFTGKVAAEIESPLVGQSSQAFEFDGDPTRVRLVFIQGNALVNLLADGFTSDELVNLANLIQAQLPDPLPEPSPISFPDQLDQAAFSKYFKEVSIGWPTADGKVEPANVFPFDGQLFGWEYVQADDPAAWNVERDYDNPMWEIAVYDLQTGQYVYRNAAIWSAGGMKMVCPVCTLQPGQYEFKLAMRGVLVFSTPFEIQE